MGLALLAVVTQPLTAAVSPATPPSTLPTRSVTPYPTATREPIVSFIVSVTPEPYPSSTPRPANEQFVSIIDFSYVPWTLQIKAGQTVTWQNDGTEQHDVTGNDWHSGALEPTFAYKLKFGVPGTYNYRCTIHLDMTGSITVS